MSHQLSSSDLDRLYEKICGKIDQDSTLEDINVSTGAVPYIALALHRHLGRFEEITITDRVSGIDPLTVTPAYPHKYKTRIQVGKIRCNDELCGVEAVQQFEDCKGCIMTHGCDRVEVGSIMFSTMMYTGFTDQDIIYKEGLLTGACTFRFHSHPPSSPPIRVLDALYDAEVRPYAPWNQNKPKLGNSIDAIHQRLERDSIQSMMLLTREEKIITAAYYTQIMTDSYQSL